MRAGVAPEFLQVGVSCRDQLVAELEGGQLEDLPRQTTVSRQPDRAMTRFDQRESDPISRPW